MELKKFSLQFVKDLYIAKAQAVMRKDDQAIAYLKVLFPELFNAKFLMDLLRSHFENIKNNRDDMNIPFNDFLTKSH